MRSSQKILDRSVWCMHSFAKLVTKLLANRLAARLQEMISPNQSAFAKGRFIEDNFMLVQQTARFLHQQRQPRILLKLDISKAFDSIACPFLMEVLQHLGFGQVWRDYQRIVSLILHSGPYEWDSRREDCSPTGSLTRGSFVSYVVHYSYGCPKPFGF
jgi:hypothetical protein